MGHAFTELRTLVETKGRNHKTDLHGDMSMCMNMYGTTQR